MSTTSSTIRNKRVRIKGDGIQERGGWWLVRVVACLGKYKAQLVDAARPTAMQFATR